MCDVIITPEAFVIPETPGRRCGHICPTLEAIPHYLHAAVGQHGHGRVDVVARPQQSHGRHGRLQHAQRQAGARAPQTHVRVAGGDDHGVVRHEGRVRERGQLVDEDSVRHPTDVVSDRLGRLGRIYQVHACRV